MSEDALLAQDEGELSSFGYKQELRRTLKVFSLFAFSFSNISITTGIFTNYGFGITHFGTAMIWLWPVATVGMLILAFVLSELASRIPLAGYSYQWGGRLLGGGFGWFIGFNILATFTLGAGGITLELIAPLVTTALGINDPSLGVLVLISVIVLVLACAICIVGVKFTARINNASVVTEVLGTVVIGLVLLTAFLIHPTPHQGLNSLFNHGPLHGNPVWYAASLALLMGIFTISGFEVSADLGEEAIGVARSVHKAIIGSVAVSGIFGMLTLICFAIATPNLNTTAAQGSPVAYVVGYWMGSAFERIFLVVVIYSVFALMLVDVASMSRLVFSFSRDNMFPFSKFFAIVNPRTRTPIRAMLFTTTLFICVLVFAAYESNAFITLIAGTPVLAMLVYLTLTIAYAIRRNRIPSAQGGFELGRWAKILIPLAVIWEIIALSALTLPSVFRDADWVALGVQGVCALWYITVLRSRLRKGTAGQALLLNRLPAASAATPEST